MTSKTIVDKLREGGTRVAKRAMGHPVGQAHASIPVNENDIDIIMADAADEIERLQAEVERLKEALTDEVQYATEYVLAAINRDLEAEIERLSMKLDEAKEWLGEMVFLGGRGCLFCGAAKYDKREECKPDCEALEIRAFLSTPEKQEPQS